MDSFSSSPAQPGSVMGSSLGGQTPASSSGLFGYGLSGAGPGSVLGSISLFNPSSMMSGAGPNSILGGPNSVLGNLGGPGSILSNHHGPSSVMSGFDRVGGPSSVVSFSGLINSVHYNDPASVSNNNLAVPMTPLAASNDFLPNMPASNIPTIMPATPMSTAVSVDVPSPTLQNIVSTVNLGVQLDLKQIALRARNAEYNPKRFAAVIMRIREPRTTALIFSSGKMVCTGAKSEETSRLAARKYARIVQKLGFNAKFTEFKVQNMVGSCDVKFPIQLEGLCITHAQFSTYEPELFPGLIYRMVKPRVVLLIFVSGKVVITGAKYKKDIDEAFNQIYPILKGFKK